MPEAGPAIDGNAAFLRLLGLVARTRLTLSQIDARIPVAHVLRREVDTPWAAKGQVMRTVLEAAGRPHRRHHRRRPDRRGRRPVGAGPARPRRGHHPGVGRGRLGGRGRRAARRVGRRARAGRSVTPPSTVATDADPRRATRPSGCSIGWCATRSTRATSMRPHGVRLLPSRRRAPASTSRTSSGELPSGSRSSGPSSTVAAVHHYAGAPDAAQRKQDLAAAITAADARVDARSRPSSRPRRQRWPRCASRP